MRRGRFLTALVLALSVMLLAAAGASAGTLYGKNPVVQGYGGVGSQAPKPPVTHHTKKATGNVAGVSVRKNNARPLSASGTLPFTGAQLGIFLVLGLMLIAGGMVLHRAGRGRSRA